ncbi:2-oxoglutarate-dependent dioxygenase AOP1.2-like [Tripterygium wilfordii]|uniref:2-oxoglutarate-dependent dioxygenase AOP1.2-like n=1 Tax=Tripterygium wilfordii TaxID=458696 RepID=A0A7J7CUV9_TRIWF|nr:probable 2-oxoglutarate-dependent dioxygenase AOP1 [Tripterygium wilfordii]KAF5737814.1 2-oxoglutarate-dependent dioxygenase AOP1.2-like [Tripterygium wilfordii]
MGSQTPLKLPVIDFTTPGALNQGSPEWDSVKVQVREALEEYGCFEAVYDELSLELRKAHFGVVEKLFDLPTDVKKLNVYEKPFHGYRGHYPDVFETMEVDCANVLQQVEENFINKFWPQGNPDLSKTIHSFSRQVAEFDGVVRRMVLESLCIEKYWEEHMNSTDYVLTVNRYLPSQNGDESHLGLLSHTDKTTTSLLFGKDLDGLEIQTKQGDWINVKLSSANSLFYMAGDALYAWTNGNLFNAIHRVMMRGNITRYTTGLFSVPKEGYMVTVPEELVDEEHPLQFKPFDHFEYLKFLAEHFDPSSIVPEVSNIKTYCGT